MSNLNEWAYTEEELAQLEEERDLNNDITIEVEIDNSTKAMKAMETQYDDLSRVFKNIKEAKGIDRSLAAEAADVLPNFNGGKSLRSYSTVATMEGYKAALEEINLGMAAAIAGIVAAVVALIVKFIGWIMGDSSGSKDSKYAKGSFKAKAEEKKKVIEESAPKAKNIYESVQDAFRRGIPLNSKGDDKAIVKSFDDLFKYVEEISEEKTSLGSFSNGSITVTDKSILVLFDELTSNRMVIINHLSNKAASDFLLGMLMDIGEITERMVNDGDDSPEALSRKSNFILTQVEKMKSYESNIDKLIRDIEGIKGGEIKDTVKFSFTEFTELLFSSQEKLLNAFTNSYLAVDNNLEQLEIIKERIDEREATEKVKDQNTGSTEVTIAGYQKAEREFASVFKGLVIKTIKILTCYKAYLNSVAHGYAFVFDVLDKAEKIIDKYIDKDADGAELAAGIREERERAFTRKAEIGAIISTLRSK